MKSKTQTPLGYLMELLDVSLADLGDYLFVAQTSISKWKTGARPLRPDSPHFFGIVEYFMLLSRDNKKREKLARLFSDLYPEQAGESGQAIEQCLRGFLGGKFLPSAALRYSLSEKSKLYIAQISVYSGEEDCKSAFAQILGYMGSEPEPATLRAILGGNLQSLGAEKQDIAALAVQLQAVLDRGHTIRALMGDGGVEFPMYEMASILAHERVEIRLLPEGAALDKTCVQCIVDSKMLLTSEVVSGQPRYAALHTDALTTQHYQARFEAYWRQSPPVFAAIQPETLNYEGYRRMIEHTVEERLDWLMPTLPYLTMSRELLMEVLEANGVPGRVWSRILHGYDELSAIPMRIYLPALALRDPQTTPHVLSMLAGKEMRLTKVQAQRHMLDTAALLRAGGRVELGLIQREPAAHWERTGVFCKRNVFAGFINDMAGSIRYTVNAKLVAGCMRAMDALAENMTEEMLFQRYVANILENAALSMRGM